MKNLIIIGARGFGREFHNGLKMRSDYGIDFVIKGFLDDKTDALDMFPGYAPIIDSVERYEVQADDWFICALGSPIYRKKYVEIIKNKGGHFMSFVSSRSVVHPNAHIGEGVMISAFCSISANTTIGDFTTIQPYCNIGHDAIIGTYCAIESYSFMGGYSRLGNNVTLHTRATILPQIRIGNNAVVGAGSVVLRNVKEGITVFGVPAKKVDW